MANDENLIRTSNRQEFKAKSATLIHPPLPPPPPVDRLIQIRAASAASQRYVGRGVFCKLHVFNCWHLLIFLLTSVLATQVVFPAPLGPTGRRRAALMARQPTARGGSSFVALLGHTRRMAVKAKQLECSRRSKQNLRQPCIMTRHFQVESTFTFYKWRAKQKPGKPPLLTYKVPIF